MTQREKIFVRILFGFLAFIVLSILLLPLVSEFIGKRLVPEMTPEKVQKLFETVGGVNEVIHEARILFDKSGTNDWEFLFPQDFTNAPAISSLYKTLKNYGGMGIWPENGKHIVIGFGNHWVKKQILIFDPDGSNTFHCPPDWFQVSSNIFASK